MAGHGPIEALSKVHINIQYVTGNIQNLYNTHFQCCHILILERGLLATGNVLKNLKYSFIIFGCWNTHWSMRTVPTGSHIRKYFKMQWVGIYRLGNAKQWFKTDVNNTGSWWQQSVTIILLIIASFDHGMSENSHNFQHPPFATDFDTSQGLNRWNQARCYDVPSLIVWDLGPRFLGNCAFRIKIHSSTSTSCHMKKTDTYSSGRKLTLTHLVVGTSSSLAVPQTTRVVCVDFNVRFGSK